MSEYSPVYSESGLRMDIPHGVYVRFRRDIDKYFDKQTDSKICVTTLHETYQFT